MAVKESVAVKESARCTMISLPDDTDIAGEADLTLRLTASSTVTYVAGFKSTQQFFAAAKRAG
jgi:hypothetical protein